MKSKVIKQRIEKSEEGHFDIARAKKAANDIVKIRKSGIFDGGKTGTEIIREWRDKRRF